MSGTKRFEWRGVAVLVARSGKRFKGVGDIAIIGADKPSGQIAFIVQRRLRRRAGTASLGAVRTVAPTPFGAVIRFEDGTSLELGGDSAFGFVLQLEAAVMPTQAGALRALSSLAEAWLAAEGELHDPDGPDEPVGNSAGGDQSDDGDQQGEQGADGLGDH